MDSAESSSDSGSWFNWNDTININNTYVGEPAVNPWAAYEDAETGLSFLGLFANVALLALVIVRAYQYYCTPTGKWKWARLHYLGALSMVHILQMTITVVTRFPGGLRWMSQTNDTCKFVTMMSQTMQLLEWMYHLVLAIVSFFHVFHPPALMGNRLFVFSLIVHVILWSLAFIFVGAAFLPYVRSNGRYCDTIDPEWRGPLLMALACMSSFSWVSYFTFITLLGMCLVKQSTDTTGQDNGMLQWIVRSRVKGGVFLVLMTVLVGATNLPMVISYVIRYSEGKFYSSDSETKIRRMHTIAILGLVYYTLFPLCCLVLQEMGLYTLIRRLRK